MALEGPDQLLQKAVSFVKPQRPARLAILISLSLFLLFVAKSLFGTLGSQEEHEVVILSSNWWHEVRGAGRNSKKVRPVVDFFKMEQLKIGNTTRPGINTSNFEQ